jgi:hypothetical protein
MRSKRRYRQSAQGRASKQASIRRTRPWLRTSGPITASGKRRSSINALKHGEYTALAIRARAERAATMRDLRRHIAEIGGWGVASRGGW